MNPLAFLQLLLDRGWPTDEAILLAWLLAEEPALVWKAAA